MARMQPSRATLVALLAVASTLPTRAAAEAATTSGAKTIAAAAAVRLRFAVVVPQVLFVGLGPSLQTVDEANRTPGAAPLAGHVLAVSLYGGRGPIWVSTANHAHERVGVIVSASASNTPTPAVDDDDDASASATNVATPRLKPIPDRGARALRTERYAAAWTYSYANTVMARPDERTRPVVYTASMP